MSITRLQQARQMYAMGQRVGGIMGSNAGSMLVTPTRDGSRPGYYGPDAGHENDPGHGSNAPGGGDGNDYNYKGPADLGVTTRTVNKVTAPNAQEYIGGQAFDVTPDTKKERELARMKQTILDAPIPNVTKKGTEYYDPTTGSLLGFAPTKTNPFSLGNIAKNIFLGIVAPQLLAGTKLGPAINTFNQVNRVAGLFNKNIDVKDTISNLFSGNNKLTSKSKSTSKSKNNTTNNGDGDGEGLASLENQAGNYDEYILLLQKLQSGNISDSEQNRFNVLKNMLGI